MPETLPEIQELEQRVEAATLPPELEEKVLRLVGQLKRMVEFRSYTAEYESISRYIDLVVSLPWTQRSEDNLDLDKAKDVLDQTHYGMENVKDRILEYIAVLNLTEERRGRKIELQTGPLAVTRASVLCFIGLPGVGKTSITYSIARALNRKFIRVAMGGMGSAAQLRGRSRSFPMAEPGLIIKGLRREKTKNPVILLDEIDRVSESAHAEIMGALLELLDPEQHAEFLDYYLDYPFDLSEALFICTANHTRGIANAVQDRLEMIEMQSYTDEEKITIGREYLLPRALESTGLTQDQLRISDSVWSQVVRPLGYDAGIRTLERTVQGICRKVARIIVEGEADRVVINEDNIDEYLSRM
ncbi:MAG: AAA family ATPase [Patescibacteria group bacterium]